jgi:ribosomal protein S18 acetylase RimI-like enzyme
MLLNSFTLASTEQAAHNSITQAPQVECRLITTPEELTAFYNIQKEVKAELDKKPGCSHFLKIKSQQALKRHLEKGFDIIGVFVNGELAGGALLTPVSPSNVLSFGSFPTGYATNGKNNAVVQTVAVAPRFSAMNIKPNLGTQILQKTYEQAALTGIENIVAKVSLTNAKSQKLFEGQGFNTTQAGFDREGSYDYVIFEKKVTQSLDPQAKLQSYIGHDKCACAVNFG